MRPAIPEQLLDFRPGLYDAAVCGPGWSRVGVWFDYESVVVTGVIADNRHERFDRCNRWNPESSSIFRSRRLPTMREIGEEYSLDCRHACGRRTASSWREL